METYMTRNEVAAKLGVGARSVDRYRRLGKLTRYTNNGYNVLFLASEVDNLYNRKFVALDKKA